MNTGPLRRHARRLRRRLARLRHAVSGSRAPGWDGQALRRVREAAGMTQGELAKRITDNRRLLGDGRRVEQVNVSRWEADEAVPSSDALAELLVVLGFFAAVGLLDAITARTMSHELRDGLAPRPRK